MSYPDRIDRSEVQAGASWLSLGGAELHGRRPSIVWVLAAWAITGPLHPLAHLANYLFGLGGVDMVFAVCTALATPAVLVWAFIRLTLSRMILTVVAIIAASLLLIVAATLLFMETGKGVEPLSLADRWGWAMQFAQVPVIIFAPIMAFSIFLVRTLALKPVPPTGPVEAA